MPPARPGLQDLPPDLLQAVLGRLDFKGRSALGATSRALKRAVFQHRCRRRELNLAVSGSLADLYAFASAATALAHNYVIVYGGPLAAWQAAALATIPSLCGLFMQGRQDQQLAHLACLTRLVHLELRQSYVDEDGPVFGGSTRRLYASLCSVSYATLRLLGSRGCMPHLWGFSPACQPSVCTAVLPSLTYLYLEGSVAFAPGTLPALKELQMQHQWKDVALESSTFEAAHPGMTAAEREGFIAHMGRVVTGCLQAAAAPLDCVNLAHVTLEAGALQRVAHGTRELRHGGFLGGRVLEGAPAVTYLELATTGAVEASMAQHPLALRGWLALQELRLGYPWADIRLGCLPALTRLSLTGTMALMTLADASPARELPALQQLLVTDCIFTGLSLKCPLSPLPGWCKQSPTLQRVVLQNVGGMEWFLEHFSHRGRAPALIGPPGKGQQVVWPAPEAAG